MKKFLALLFVCAGLTAMAAPHVNKAELAQVNKGQMLMKSNTMTQHYTSAATQSFMAGAKQALQSKRVNPENLVNQRAPRRLSNEDIISTPAVMFQYIYDITGDEPVKSDPFYNGGAATWYPDASNGLYLAGLYYPAIFNYTYYLPVDVDYSTGEVSLSWGMKLEDDSVIGTARNRTDSVYYELLVSQAYWENNEQKTDCKGTLYEDGSIIFDDNYVYYSYLELRTYVNNNLSNTQVIEKANMYVGTEILAANGELTYNMEQTGAASSNPVFMYQSNDSLFVGNMWDYGVPSSCMVLTPEAKAVYNCAEFNPEDSVTYLSNPIWDVADDLIDGGLGMFYPIGSYELDDEGYIIDYTWGFEADATPDQITWPYTMPSNGYHFLYGYQNNVLRYTNGDKFVIPAPAGLRGDVNDSGEVTIADVSALIDALLVQEFDDVPGKFNADNADCNKDGSISIADVSALIDYLLTKAW